MKKKKKIISFFWVVLLAFNIGTSVEAADFNDLGKIVDGSELVNENKSVVTQYNDARVLLSSERDGVSGLYAG